MRNYQENRRQSPLRWADLLGSVIAPKEVFKTGENMGRAGYSDDVDGWQLIRWRGMVASALRGKRGQRLLVDLVAALDAMPNKRLTKENLVLDGEVCALGAVGKARGVSIDTVDPYDYAEVSKLLDIAPCLAQEISFENDEACYLKETPEQRWKRMREWALSKKKKDGPDNSRET